MLRGLGTGPVLVSVAKTFVARKQRLCYPLWRIVCLKMNFVVSITKLVKRTVIFIDNVFFTASGDQA